MRATAGAQIVPTGFRTQEPSPDAGSASPSPIQSVSENECRTGTFRGACPSLFVP
jgi:hypothetical protein